MKFRRARGYTLIELMIVVAIIGILASISLPRVQILLDRAYEGKAKGQIGALRSALQLYYSDTEGGIPFFNEPDGVASDRSMYMSQVLTPTYIAAMPVPHLADRYTFVPGLYYDDQTKFNMGQTPQLDIVFVRGAPTAVLVNRPFAYDPTNGYIYFCNGNYSIGGDFYYNF